MSAASALEIATKIRIGKLDAPDLVVTLPRHLDDHRATLLPITVEHALLAGSMAWTHRDPFDRLLVAQAALERAIPVTVDSALTNLAVPQVLTW